MRLLCISCSWDPAPPGDFVQLGQWRLLAKSRSEDTGIDQTDRRYLISSLVPGIILDKLIPSRKLYWWWG